MNKYQFTGDYPEVFLDLGKELQPGDFAESDKPLDHPRLQEVKAKQEKKAEVNE